MCSNDEYLSKNRGPGNQKGSSAAPAPAAPALGAPQLKAWEGTKIEVKQETLDCLNGLTIKKWELTSQKRGDLIKLDLTSIKVGI
jgi:hypothetical protein